FPLYVYLFFFFNHPPPTQISTLSLHDALPIYWNRTIHCDSWLVNLASECGAKVVDAFHSEDRVIVDSAEKRALGSEADAVEMERDRKSTRLNSSHVAISYAVFCLKKKKNSMMY